MASICGNLVVEDGEACDCGYPDDCTDTCCDTSTCQLVAGADCSPTNDHCCEADCSIKPAVPQYECRAQSGCRAAAYCEYPFVQRSVVQRSVDVYVIRF